MDNGSTPIVTGYEKITKGGIQVVERMSLMEQIREEASRRVVAKEGFRGIGTFFEALEREALSVWLEFFPRICEEMRQVNHEKWKIMQEISSQGRFTGSVGWSASGNFKFEYEYTPEFYFFMQHYVFDGFFLEPEKKIRNQFMKKILRGDSALDTLVWLKKRYGSNQQESPVVHGGARG